MSREAPPREAPLDIDSSADGLRNGEGAPTPPKAPFSALWLGLPLLAWTVPFDYHMAAHGRVDINTFGRGFMRSLWFGVSALSVLLLVSSMAARRKGRALWVAFDVMAGSLPWVVALAQQSIVSRQSAHPHWHDASRPLWGAESTLVHAFNALQMHEPRGLGALMSASLWAGAAVGWLLPTDNPRWRGATLLVVVLPVWGIAYSFSGDAGALPALGAGLLSVVLAITGTQTSVAARERGRAALVLATLALLALLVATVCDAIVAMGMLERPGFLSHHSTLLGLLSAARLGAIVCLLPAALASRWLIQKGDARPATAATVALLLAFVGVLGLDRVGTRMALERTTPEPSPPWAGADVHPLAVASGTDWQRSHAHQRFILSAGVLQDAQGQTVAPLSDPRRLGDALQATFHARGPREGTSPRDPLESLGTERSLGSRLAIVAMPAAPQRSDCPGPILTVLVDRSASMADLRAFVSAATTAGVSELDVAGPLALAVDEKRALAEVLRRAGQDGAFPLGSTDELAYLDAMLALPRLGVPALDALRLQAAASPVALPSACWRTTLLGEPDAAVPGDTSPDGAREQPQDPGEVPPGEVVNEAMFDEAPVVRRPPVALWLDPARDVAAVLMESTTTRPGRESVIWLLDPPAP